MGIGEDRQTVDSHERRRLILFVHVLGGKYLLYTAGSYTSTVRIEIFMVKTRCKVRLVPIPMISRGSSNSGVNKHTVCPMCPIYDTIRYEMRF